MRVLAAVLVVGAGEQHAGELAVRAGATAAARRAAGRRSRPARPGARHISSSAPCARVGCLQRVQAGVAGQRRDALVQLRVVLHRARAERVEARVEVEVALARGGCSGARSPARRPRAASAARRGGGARGAARRAALGHVERRAATNARRPGLERSKIVVARSRCCGVSDRGRAAMRRALDPGSACRRLSQRPLALRRTARAEHVGEPVDVRPRALLGDRHQQPVVARESASGSRG